MGWATNLYTCLEFNKNTFRTKNDVEREVEEAKDMLESARNRLKGLAFMTEPSKFCGQDEDPYYFIENEFNVWIDEFEEMTVKLYKLEKLLEEWDSSHDENDNAIAPPENLRLWERSFCDGDFLNVVKFEDLKENAEESTD